MPRIDGGIKLKYGTPSRVARKLGLSLKHVSEVAKGVRQGSPELLRALRTEAARQAKQTKHAA